MTEKLYPTLPTAPSMNYQETFHISTVRKYYQEIIDLRDKYQKKQQRYKKIYNKLLHTSTGATSLGVISGVSAVGTSFTVVGLPVGASLSVVALYHLVLVGFYYYHQKSIRKNY